MRIIMFSVKEEEVPAIKAWSEAFKVGVDYFPDDLNLETVHRVEGYDGLVMGQMYEIEPEVYQRLEDYGIKQISQRSAGFDMYDLKLAKAHNLVVTNVPSYSPETIAEFTIQSALTMIRKTDLIQDHVSRQDFSWDFALQGRTIHNKRVGIIGVGRIGSRAAKLFHAFGAKVQAYDIAPNRDLDFIDYKDSAEEAVEGADIVSLHVPLDESTYYLVNEHLLSHFKEGALLINHARGGVVDTWAMIHALDQGQLKQAAIDVYENEAPYVTFDWSDRKIEDELFQEVLNHPKIIYTNHVAYYSDTAVQNMVQTALTSAYEVMTTGTSGNRVN